MQTLRDLVCPLCDHVEPAVLDLGDRRHQRIDATCPLCSGRLTVEIDLEDDGEFFARTEPRHPHRSGSA